MSHDPVEIKPELSQQERELVVKTRNMIYRNQGKNKALSHMLSGGKTRADILFEKWVESKLRRMGAIR